MADRVYEIGDRVVADVRLGYGDKHGTVINIAERSTFPYHVLFDGLGAVWCHPLEIAPLLTRGELDALRRAAKYVIQEVETDFSPEQYSLLGRAIIKITVALAQPSFKEMAISGGGAAQNIPAEGQNDAPERMLLIE